jgi:hypothetical protein
MAYGKSLEKRRLRPHKYLPEVKGEFRLQHDGSVYLVTARGWRKVNVA